MTVAAYGGRDVQGTLQLYASTLNYARTFTRKHTLAQNDVSCETNQTIECAVCKTTNIISFISVLSVCSLVLR